MSKSDPADRPSARAAPEEAISGHECRAMRCLDADADYSRPEIAFMFGCKATTVAQHADRECHHQRLTASQSYERFSDEDLLLAYRLVYDRQPYRRMSEDVYREYRPEEFPSYGTIQRRFGSWTAARERAFGGDEDD